MAEINVNVPHTLSADEAKNRASAFEEMMSKYGVKAKWKGHEAQIKGLGVSGTMSITGSNVQVKLKLGMMAKAAGVDAKRLQASIERRLREGLAD